MERFLYSQNCKRNKVNPNFLRFKSLANRHFLTSDAFRGYRTAKVLMNWLTKKFLLRKTSHNFLSQIITVKPPNSGHPKQRTKCLVSNTTIFVKLPPNSRHLLITDNFFKSRRCPLFRGFTILMKKSVEHDIICIDFIRIITTILISNIRNISISKFGQTEKLSSLC